MSGDKNCTGHSQSEAARVIEELVVNVRSRIPKRNHAIEVQDTCGGEKKIRPKSPRRDPDSVHRVKGDFVRPGNATGKKCN